MVPQHDDEILALRAQQGDREAFRMLYGLYVDKVYNRVRSRVPFQYAEDVTQDVFIAVIRSLDSYQHRSRFNTWLYTIVNRQIADFYRRYRDRPDVSVDLDTDDWLDAALVYDPEDTEDWPLLQVAFHALPEHYQEVILLRFADGLSFEEIAQERGQSLEAVKSLYRRAIQAIREKLNGPQTE
ncbi:MAG TPA: RNA polymerase sigma factor [Aggregatilinea sp.]|jgi:RNA polymerase sigma-70 factor (ECF subfamily)|uniref:RNA polymerase sigma factor n=1 Tax=Aggregatilinea sp. TaxID=2806333 RepID=UPI002C9E7C65|nr:RNA polymerase sigma factor [Aggregatilinea sp.]HML24206.1 RNA polymerase sigma factor [Aggregatilinea sp.]